MSLLLLFAGAGTIVAPDNPPYNAEDVPLPPFLGQHLEALGAYVERAPSLPDTLVGNPLNPLAPSVGGAPLLPGTTVEREPTPLAPRVKRGFG